MISAQTKPAVQSAKAPSAASTVERMASTMRDMRAAGHTVTAESLAVYGDYSSAEISRHGVEASNLARQLETRAA